MKLLRTIVFWSHLFVGVAAGLVILVMSLTGALLAVDLPVTNFANRSYRHAPAEGEQRLAMAELVEAVEAERGQAPSAVAYASDPAAPAEARLGRRQTVFVNPYTGEVLGEGSEAVDAFFGWNMRVHRWLAQEGEARAIGGGITGAANLAFVGIILSGLFLWVPKRLKWRSIRPVLWFKGGLRSKTRDWNWHNVLGFWCAIPLLLFSATGVVISYDWAGDLVRTLAGAEPPAERGRGGGGTPEAVEEVEPQAWSRRLDGVDEAFAAVVAEAGDGWNTIALALPESDAERLTFTVDRGNGRQPHKRRDYVVPRDSSAVTVEAQPGFEALTAERKARSFIRFAHTGEWFGTLGWIVGVIACLAGAFLVYTGLALSFRRLVLNPIRRRRPRTVGA